MSVTTSSPLSAPTSPKPTNSGLGLLYMFLGMSLFAATDATAKFLTETLHPMQIVWSRQCGLLLGILIFIAFRGFAVLKSTQPALQISRGVFAATSATLFIIAVAYVPLADAVAITFVAPFIVTVLGALVLGEKVGIRRWTAVVIGFLGTLVVIRPGLGVVHPAAFLLVLAASVFAGRQILSRVLANGDSTATTVAYTGLVSWALLTIPLPFFWEMPATYREIILLVGIAITAAFAEILVIMALDTAEAVVVAPVQYSLLLWGTMYGFLIFGQLPDVWTWVGSVIIVATGIYTIHRERKLGSKS